MSDNNLKTISEDMLTIFQLFHKKIMNGKNMTENVGLSRSHYEVLFLLDDLGAVPMTEIARNLSLSKPYVTSLVDTLIDNSLVERLPDKDDRRVIKVALTESGKIFLNEHKELIINNIKTKIQQLKSEEIEKLLMLANNMKEIVLKLKL